jgi:hypothetical protein
MDRQERRGLPVMTAKMALTAKMEPTEKMDWMARTEETELTEKMPFTPTTTERKSWPVRPELLENRELLEKKETRETLVSRVFPVKMGNQGLMEVQDTTALPVRKVHLARPAMTERPEMTEKMVLQEKKEIMVLMAVLALPALLVCLAKTATPAVLDLSDRKVKFCFRKLIKVSLNILFQNFYKKAKLAHLALLSHPTLLDLQVYQVTQAKTESQVTTAALDPLGRLDFKDLKVYQEKQGRPVFLDSLELKAKPVNRAMLARLEKMDFLALLARFLVLLGLRY